MKWIGAILFLAAGILAGCGGGGGAAAAPTPTLEIAVRAALSSTVLHGVQLTVRLPPGVTVAAKANGELADGVLTPKISARLAMGTYVPAGADTPATVTIILATDGFAVGDVVNVACQVAPGVAPTAASFSVTDFAAWSEPGGDNVVPIDGITPELSFAYL